MESNGDRVTRSYDKTYQLTNEQRSGSNSYNITYTYDPVGNRTNNLSNTINLLPYYLSSNLVAYYNFNEGSGTTANENSGNGNIGTISEAAYSGTTPFPAGFSLSFNGTSDYVDMGSGSSLNITGPITMSAWINISASGGDYLIIGGFAGSPPYPGYGFLVGGVPGSTNDGHLAYWSGAFGNWVEGHTAVNDGNWHFVAVTVTGSTVQFYIDGVADGAPVTSSQPNSYSGPRTIGKGENNSAWWNGLLDDVHIYNTALSAANIANLYNNVNLAGYYNFNEGSGTTAIDDSGNGNTGTINGAAYSAPPPSDRAIA